jgi:hypothetical protein
MTTVQSGSQIVANSSVLSSGIASVDHLTPDGLMLYMETRLGGIDAQVEAAFDKQKKIEAIRKELMKIQTVTAGVVTEGGTLDEAQIGDLRAAIARLIEIDDMLGRSLKKDLRNAGIYRATENDEGKEVYEWKKEYTAEMGAMLSEAVGSRLKQLESSASLEMIQLQSLMSARQTAISLCTNLVSALGKGEEAIVGNIGR